MKIDFGSGYNPRVGYLKCDITQSPALELSYDIEMNRIIQRDGSELQENSATLVRMKNVVHHIPDFSAVFREIHRILKVGGHLVVIEPSPKAYPANLFLDTLWYRGVLQSNDTWFSPIYRNYNQSLTNLFMTVRVYNDHKEGKEITITTKGNR